MANNFVCINFYAVMLHQFQQFFFNHKYLSITAAAEQDLLIKNRISQQVTEKIGPSLQKKYNLDENFAQVTRFNVIWANTGNAKKLGGGF